MSDKAEVTVKNGVISVDKDWVFTETGIVIDDDPNKQFSDPYCSEDGQTFTWRDANTDGKSYEYTIWVQKGSDDPISLDPTIQNKGLTTF